MEAKAIILAREWFYKNVHGLPVSTFNWESMGEYSHRYWIAEAGKLLEQ